MSGSDEERWVPVDPEDIRPGDTVRTSAWNLSDDSPGVVVRHPERIDRTVPWERLESETVSLPVPPEGARWRLMPDDVHGVVQNTASDLWAWYRELNAEHESPIETGMWVQHIRDQDCAYWVEKRTATGWVMWWRSSNSVFPWEVGHESGKLEGHYRQCDPPDNAQELYDLLGIPTQIGADRGRSLNAEPDPEPPPLTRGDLIRYEDYPRVYIVVGHSYSDPTNLLGICEGWSGWFAEPITRVDPDTVDPETLRKLRACAFIDDEVG